MRIMDRVEEYIKLFGLLNSFSNNLIIKSLYESSYLYLNIQLEYKVAREIQILNFGREQINQVRMINNKHLFTKREIIFIFLLHIIQVNTKLFYRIEIIHKLFPYNKYIKSLIYL